MSYNFLIVCLALLWRLYDLIKKLLYDTVGFIVGAFISYRGLIMLQVVTACIVWVWMLENTASLAVS
jgi:hypothetical protein